MTAKGNQQHAKEPKGDQSERDLIEKLHTKDGSISSDRLFGDRVRWEKGTKGSRTCTICRRLSARDTVSGPLERLTITCPPLPAGLRSDK